VTDITVRLFDFLSLSWQGFSCRFRFLRFPLLSNHNSSSCYAQLNVKSVSETCKRTTKILLHILRNLLVPARLLQQLIMPGLRLEPSPDEDDSGQLVVRHRWVSMFCCDPN
jgi:hypothetical protein